MDEVSSYKASTGQTVIPEEDANSNPVMQHNEINEYPWLPVSTHHTQYYPHALILKATLLSLKAFS